MKGVFLMISETEVKEGLSIETMFEIDWEQVQIKTPGMAQMIRFLYEILEDRQVDPLSDQMLRNLIISFAEKSLIDTRFGVPNYKAMKLKIKRIYLEFIREAQRKANGDLNRFYELLMEATRRAALIIGDVNHLKAVNDTTGSHEAGNKFLNITVSKFQANPQTNKRLDTLVKKNALVSEVGTMGRGDEIILSLKHRLQPLDQFISLEAKKPINMLRSVGNGINNALYRVNLIRAIPIEVRLLEERAGMKAPSGLRFPISVGMGAGTFFLGNSMVIESFEMPQEINGDAVLDALADALIKFVESLMYQAKERYKENLNQSEDPRDAFLRRVFYRTDEERRLDKALQEARMQIKKLEEELEEQKRMVELQRRLIAFLDGEKK